MSVGRPAPMVPIGCRIPRALAERIARLVAGTGFERCDVIRRALDLGATTMEREVTGDGEGQQT